MVICFKGISQKPADFNENIQIYRESLYVLEVAYSQAFHSNSWVIW